MKKLFLAIVALGLVVVMGIGVFMLVSNGSDTNNDGNLVPVGGDNEGIIQDNSEVGGTEVAAGPYDYMCDECGPWEPLVLFEWDGTNLLPIGGDNKGVIVDNYVFGGTGQLIGFDWETTQYWIYNVHVKAANYCDIVPIYEDMYDITSGTYLLPPVWQPYGISQVAFCCNSSPCKPIPELSTIGLFSLGLVGIGGFVWFMRRRKANRVLE